MRKLIVLYFIMFLLSLYSTARATERVNLALGKTISARVNDMNGASSNDETAYKMIDGNSDSVWESVNSYKQSILIDLGSDYKITKVVIKWADGQAANTCDLKLGKQTDRMVQVWSKKDLTETEETILDGFGEEASLVQLIFRGRIVADKPYKIKEIEIYSVPNLAFGKEVTTRVTSITGAFSNNENAHLITDGNPDTYWEGTNAYKISVLVDLGDVYDITKVIVKWADGQSCVSCDLNFGTQTDKMVQIWSKNNLTETVESVHSGLNQRARYFELLLRGRMNGKNYKIKEIEIYNEGYIPHTNTEEEQAAIDIVTSRLIKKQLETAFNDANVTSYASAMLADGSWSDINYKDEISADTWEPNIHLNRLKAMAICANSQESSWYNNVDLLSQIQNGLLYFKDVAPYCSDNWWYNDIGAPQIYMVPLLLLKSHVEAKELYEMSSYLRNQIDRFAGGGKNLTWISEISMYKACSENNFEVVTQAFEATASTLVIVPTQGDEGIKIDGSFHQHHAQLYSGGYGLSMVQDISNTLDLLNGTIFERIFTTERMNIYQNLVLDGVLLLSHRNIIDFGAVGRNISRDATLSTLGLSFLEKEINRGGNDVEIYKAWKNHVESGSPFPLSTINKYFWKSDIMVQHGDNYYMSAKIISKRTYGTESLNNENIKGYNLPLGATNILMTGSEYHKIYPIWDWTRVPGTTAVQNQKFAELDGYLIGTNELGGGVSDGTNGIIAYDHDYKGLKAKKAYFFMDGMMLCLGNGITFDQDESVATSVNQSFLSGNVTINDEATHSLTSDKSESSSSINWVHHNNVGYIFPANGNITVQNLAQTGSWRQINATGNTSSITKNVFSLWINHGINPVNSTYQYIVAPDRTSADIQYLANNHGFVIAENNSVVQALRKGLQYGIVFYEPGAVTMDDGLVVSSDKAAMVLININEKDGKEYEISVSDPLYKEAKITLTLNRIFADKAIFNSSENKTELTFNLPQNDYTGSTITNVYKEDQAVSIANIRAYNESDTKANIHIDAIKSHLTISFTANDFEYLEIFNVGGKAIRKEMIPANIYELSIAIDDYTPGVYLVKLVGKNKTLVQKLLIER